MVDAGGTVRHGIIMLGYHNRAFSGDVLLVDGEIIGEWTSDDEEWCHFTANDAAEITCSAPPPWILHDSIADWVKRGDDTKSLDLASTLRGCSAALKVEAKGRNGPCQLV